MLCLNCIYARNEVPAEVKVEVRIGEKVEIVDISNRLVELWKMIERRGYTTIIYCEKLKEIRVGTPPSPAKTVTECAEFTEA